MEKTKMTKREFLNAVIEANVSEEITEFATEEIGKIDKANGARQAKTTEKTAEFNAFAAEVAAGVEVNAVVTATEMAEKLGISVQKTSSVLRRATELGYFTKAETKITGKGRVMAYTRV